MCQLVFITDKGRKLGPYGYATGDPLYNVEFKGKLVFYFIWKTLTVGVAHFVYPYFVKGGLFCTIFDLCHNKMSRYYVFYILDVLKITKKIQSNTFRLHSTESTTDGLFL